MVTFKFPVRVAFPISKQSLACRELVIPFICFARDACSIAVLWNLAPRFHVPVTFCNLRVNEGPAAYAASATLQIQLYLFCEEVH